MESSNSGVELIRAKTLVPLARSGVVARTALLNRFATAAGKQLVLVRAPAGYGKSTVLSQWAHADTARRFAWVSLDPSDNDPVVFWRYVLSAIRSHEPEFAPAAWESLGGPAPQLEETVLPGVVNGLVDLGPGLVVILDDYHRVTSRRVHETVRLFVDYLPRSTRLVISSRSVPPLGLGRMRARGLVEEIGRTDLAFSIEETSLVLAGQRGDHLVSDASEIHRRTEGWAAGVYLAAVTHPPNAGQRIGENGASDAIRDYLIQELIGTLPDEDRSFLLETSILDRMNGDVCDFVTGGTGSTQRLGAGVQQNLLIVPLDDEGRWYRYHHMFQDVLRSELSRTRPDEVAALHMRAHDWCVKYGLVSEAIDHALAAGNVEAAAELACRHAFAYITTGRLETARQWLVRFSDEDRRAYPPLLVASGWTAAFLGDGWNARRLARLAADVTYDGPPPDGMSSFEASVSLLFRGITLGGMAETRDSALSARSTEPLESPWRPLIECQFGISSMALGDLETAEEAFERATHLISGEDALLAYVLTQQAIVATQQGRWEEAARHASRAVDLIEELSIQNLVSSCSAYAISASIALHSNLVVEAKRYVRIGSSSQQPLTDAIGFDSFMSHLHLAEVHLALEDYVAAGIHSRAASAAFQIVGDVGILERRLDALVAALDDQDLEVSAVQPGPDSLTTRERQILQLMPSDKSLREIAHELYVSRNTAKTHTTRIYKKLGASSREEAVMRAIELHLI
jgi:LuxR family maltose regulon positive regulatory protein